MQNRDVRKERLEASLKRKTRMEWMPLMIEHGIPAGPINNLEDVFNDPQVLACGIVQSADHPKVGQLKQVGLPVNLSNMNGEGSVRTAPTLDRKSTRLNSSHSCATRIHS